MIKVQAVRNVHGSGWIKFRRFFDPTHYGESKKIQPNPTHGLDNFFLLLLLLN